MQLLLISMLITIISCFAVFKTTSAFSMIPGSSRMHFTLGPLAALTHQPAAVTTTELTATNEMMSSEQEDAATSNKDGNNNNNNNPTATVVSTSASTEQQHPPQPAQQRNDRAARARALRMPVTGDDMVRQAASASRAALAQGTRRQVVRLLLPRDRRSNEFGKYFETSSSNYDNNSVVLVPPDESWQGGILQLYRAAQPITLALLRRLTESVASGLPPRVVEDRSVDESGVDGIGLFTTDNGQVSCWLQPTQEVIDQVVKRVQDQLSNDNYEHVTLLINPQWRQVDDALDSASKGTGFFAGLANFLGGKGGTLQALTQANFVPVYTLEGYVCRGANVRLLQTHDSDWAVFCERDDSESFLNVGTSPQRPTYQQVEQMLQAANIGYKYARDMGMEPNL